MATTISNRRILIAVLLYQIGLTSLMCILFQINYSDDPITWDTIVGIFSRWDARHYIFISEFGYQSSGEEASYIAFYPLYPTLIRALSFLIPYPHIAGLIISVLGSIVGHFAFIKYLTEIGFDNEKCWRIAILFFLTPVTVYFSNLYTESLFLAETALFLFFLERRQYQLAVLCGFCASATRLAGIFLIVPYVFHFIDNKNWRTNLTQLSQGLIIILGFLLYLLVNFIVYADPFYFRSVLSSSWQKEVGNPLLVYLKNVRQVFQHAGRYRDSPTIAVDHYATLLAPILIFVYSFFKLLKKYRISISWGLILWSVAQLWIVVSQTWWISSMRYVCLILPLYIMLEEVTWKFRPLYYATVAVFGFLAVYGVYLFTKGAWLY